MSEPTSHNYPAATGVRVEADGTGGRPNLSERVRSLRLPDKVDVPRSGGGWLPWLLCLLLAGSLGALGVQYARSKMKDAKADAEKKFAAAPPEGGGEEVVLEAKGYVVAAHQIQVSPIDVAGRIEEIFFVEGQQFNKGDTLATLDDT